jgi:hypothetical protein
MEQVSMDEAGSCLRCGCQHQSRQEKTRHPRNDDFRCNEEAFHFIPLCQVPRQLVAYRLAKIDQESITDPGKSLS